MTISKQFVGSSRVAARAAGALTLVLSLLASTLAIGVGAAQKQKTQAARLSEDQRVMHVLNRLGFGARPGDVDRVRRIGVEKYIEQQLHP